MTSKAMENVQLVKDVLQKYREDSKMTQKEWHKFCSRYNGRNVSTVVQCLTRLYGELPKNAHSIISRELELEEKRHEAYISYSNR